MRIVQAATILALSQTAVQLWYTDSIIWNQYID